MLGAGTAQAARTCRNGVCGRRADRSYMPEWVRGRSADRSHMPEWVCGRCANRSDMPEWVCSGGASRSTCRISVRRRRPQPLGAGIGARWPCVSPSSIAERVRCAAIQRPRSQSQSPQANLALSGGGDGDGEVFRGSVLARRSADATAGSRRTRAAAGRLDCLGPEARCDPVTSARDRRFLPNHF